MMTVNDRRSVELNHSLRKLKTDLVSREGFDKPPAIRRKASSLKFHAGLDEGVSRVRGNVGRSYNGGIAENENFRV